MAVLGLQPGDTVLAVWDVLSMQAYSMVFPCLRLLQRTLECAASAARSVALHGLG